MAKNMTNILENNFSDILKTDAYAFLQSNEHLGKHIILLGLAGSYSYGTTMKAVILMYVVLH